jgi:SH3-like domain-containing protein
VTSDILTTLRRGCLVAAICCLPPVARAQTPTDDPAPYLHQKTHQATTVQAKLKVKVKPKAKPVPVIAPHHPGPPRHASHAAAKSAPHKVVVEEPPKPVAKKPAPPPLPADVGTDSGLHLPRYAALKSDQVNMRSGPGERYPVLWTYQRRDLPVKIEREFDIWRLVEDMDGIKGWMQKGFIAGHRSFVITGTDDRILRADANDTADAVADLKPGVVGRIKACDPAKDWCQVQVQEFSGWLKRSDFWGVDPGEAVTP